MNEKNLPIKLMVTNTATYVEGEISKDLYDGLRKELGYTPDDAHFRIKYVQQKTKQKWDGHISLVHRNKRYCRCEVKKDGIHFPTGLYSKAIAFLKRYSVPYQTFDKRKKNQSNLSLEMSKDFELRDYQQDIIYKAANQERGIIKLATGGGKTSVSAAIIKEIGEAPFIFYVPSIDLMKQAQDEFQKFLLYNGMNAEVGSIGGGVFDPKEITIMTLQTAVRACGSKYIRYDDEESKNKEEFLEEKRKDILDLIMSAKGIIVDECVTGDSIVHIKNHGDVKMSELNNFIGEDILSFNGTNVVWEKITCFMEKGKKNLIKILLDSDKYIKCTKNHLIKTQRGWVQAGSIRQTDRVLSCANVDACDIKYVGIKKIEKIESDYVYDITVENTHCFFANGLLVHNCQHVASPTCQTISDYSVSARYRFGVSATPFRDQNDDILIDACFGKQIADISASFLIERGYLVKPDIYFVDVKAECEKQFAYQAIYKKSIVENQVRNEYISNIANNMYQNDKTILVLVKQLAHGKLLQSMIPDSVFLHGVHSGKKRKEHLDKMRRKEAPVTIASVIFDEGIDCRPLDTLILAGSGKSPTRALQRIGRTLRPYTSPSGEKKEAATIIDFMDHYKYLRDHSNRRKNIYKTESLFNVSNLEI